MEDASEGFNAQQEGKRDEIWARRLRRFPAVEEEQVTAHQPSTSPAISVFCNALHDARMDRMERAGARMLTYKTGACLPSKAAQDSCTYLVPSFDEAQYNSIHL